MHSKSKTAGENSVATPVQHQWVADTLTQHSAVVMGFVDDQEIHCRVPDIAVDIHLALGVAMRSVALDAAAASSAPHFHQKATHILTSKCRSRWST